MTRAKIKVHRFFFCNIIPQFGELKTSLRQKLIWRKNKTAAASINMMTGRKKIPCNGNVVRYTTRIVRFLFFAYDISDDFGLKSPVIHKTLSPKNGIP